MVYEQQQALAIIENAKVQRPGVCNALECLLVHEGVAREFLPRLAESLAPLGVSFRACPRSLPLLGAAAVPAEPDDFGREFLALILAVKIVATQAEAEEHIARYGSGHSEAILTRAHERAMRFLRTVTPPVCSSTPPRASTMAASWGWARR